MRPGTALPPIAACGGVGLALAVVLTLLLALSNPGPWSAGALIELFVVCLWIALLMSAAFGVASALVFALLRLLLPSLRGHLTAFIVSGTLALHGFWALLNRIQQPQHVIFPPRFLPWDGAVQLALMLVLVPAVVAVGVGMGARRRWGVPAAVSLAAVVAGLLAWNAAGERQVRRPSLEEVQAAAREGLSATLPATARVEGLPVMPEAITAPGRGPRVVALGLDGLSWNVIEPLMRAGHLPHFARLVQEGAVAYLDNGNDSFSPRIWNTIWSGRSARDHRVYDFLRVVLPRSGRTLPNLPSQHPSIDVVFGLRQLFRRIPNPGLWVLGETDSRDLRVKRVWDVTSDYGLRAAVANPLNLFPAAPIRGAAISYDHRDVEGRAFPPELAERYDLPPIYPKTVDAWRRLLALQVPYTVELFERHGMDLGVYFTPAIDWLTHAHWNFFAPDAFLMTDLPRSWDDARWRREVLLHADAPAFAGYALLDDLVGVFRDAFPDALLLICSDHGWTFSGFQHYGSPDGVLLLAGPGVAAGARLDSAEIGDVTPTILAALGVPLSEELVGAPLERAFTGPLRATRVASYGAPKPRQRDLEPVDEEALEHLEALGYVQ